MPPFPAWFSGRETIGEFMATVFARGGSFRFAVTQANGQPAIGVYVRRADHAHRFLHIQVLTMDSTGIARIDGFHYEGLFADFGLPAVLPG
jgi:RNA polymerase sigma-70 factor, ECF subfamily